MTQAQLAAKKSTRIVTKGRPVHEVELCIGGNWLPPLMLNLDEIEDIELQLTDLIAELATYRKREELME